MIERFVAAGNARDCERLDEFVADDIVRYCQATPGLVIAYLEQVRVFVEAGASV